MIVENREPRVYCIGDLKLKKNQKPIEPGVPPEPADALLPGMNEVDEKVWNEHAMKNPLVQYLVDKGVLVPVAHTTAPEEVAKMSGPEAIDLVRRTFDKALLERYAKVEKRKAVLEMIDRQLKEITPSEKKDD